MIEIRLRDRGVRFVRTGGADALVLVVDVRGCLQRLLEPHRAQQRRGPPERVDVANGDVAAEARKDLRDEQEFLAVR